MTDYLTDFVQESEERITELNNALLTLERDPTDDEAMENIFRVAHTLKGNCGAMGLEPASDLAHAIEDLLDAVRSDDLEVTPELMDVIFDAVDELETMVDEVAADGEIETDPSATIRSLREYLESESLAESERGHESGPQAITTPSTDEIDAVIERFEPPADDEHEAYLVRLAVAEREDVNNGKLVVDALIDAFDLIGTEPPQSEIEAGEYDGRFDAVFGSAVGEAAISSGLEPVEEVAEFELVNVSDRFVALGSTGTGTGDADADADGDTDAEVDEIAPEDAEDLEVDELLDEFDEFDDLDSMVEEMDDDDLDPFEDMGEAGSFDELLDEDELDLEAGPGEPVVDPLGDDAEAADTEDVEADATTTATDDTQPTDDENVEDANEVFNELKNEVEMVGFDELQDELADLEFDEFDNDDEVDMDELIGEDVDVDDGSFFDETEPGEDAVDDILVDADTDADADVIADADVDADVDADADVVADADVDAGVDADADVVADAGVDADTDATDQTAADALDDDGAFDTGDEVAMDDLIGDAAVGDADSDDATAPADTSESAVDDSDGVSASTALEAEDDGGSDHRTEDDSESEPGDDSESEPGIEPDSGTVDDVDDIGSDVSTGAESAPAETDSLSVDEADGTDGADESGDSSDSVTEPVDSATDPVDSATETDGEHDAEPTSAEPTVSADDADLDDSPAGTDGSISTADTVEPELEDEADTADDGIEAGTEPDPLETDGVDEAVEADTTDVAVEADGTNESAEADGTSDPAEANGTNESAEADETDDSFGAGSFDEDPFGTDETDGFDTPADDPFADEETDEFETESFDDDPFDDGEDDYDSVFEDDSFAESATDDEFADDEFDTELSTSFDDAGSAATDDNTDNTDSTDDDRDEDDEHVRRVDEPTLESPSLTIPETDERPDAAEQTDEIQSVRVDVEQIDSLLTLVEGLVTTRVRLRHAVNETDETAALETELDDLEGLTTELQETVMDIRLVPLQTVTNRLPRVVRDIARDQEKEVAFEMSGEDIELDRSILDRIGDPLIHLVRNAVDHGIESPDEREAADKPREGTVEVHADRSRDRVTITVEDDGSGLDPDRLRSEAVEADILTEDEAGKLPDDKAHELIFHPGLSTTDEVTDVSGRGVGMDVVKRTIEDLEGTVSIDSEVGGGTTVTMTLPVTVAIDDILFVECGGEEFGVPTKAVQDIEPADRLRTADGDGHGRVHPEDDYAVVRLDETLETPRSGTNDDGMLVRIRDEVRPVVLHCDDVHGQQEVVVKPFEGFMSGIPGLSGATVRGRGEVVNILDVTTL